MKRKIVPRHLQPGFVLPGSLYSNNGKVLAREGTRLEADQLVLITTYIEDGLYGDDAWPDEFTDSPNHPGQAASPSEHARHIDVSSLESGMRLTQDICDANTDVLLLAAGFQITPRFLRLLTSRGIKTIRVRPRADRHEERPRETMASPADVHARSLDALLDEELKKRIPFREITPTERPRLALDDLKNEAHAGVEDHFQTKRVVAEVCDSLVRGADVAGADINNALRTFVTRATLDIDLLPLIVSLHNAGDEYLFDHSVNVALLSMSMAAQAGLPMDKILEIGFGGLLQDVGMMRIPEEIRSAPRELTMQERMEVDRHPLYSIEFLANVNLALLTAGLILYQSHERCDGTGYPCNQIEARIHPYARIVGIADTFAAMTSDRPYRKAYRPYEAAREILTNLGRFDRETTRLFLDTVGLFPIGSVVELSNGQTGQVIRIIPGAHTRPVIELLGAKNIPSGRLVNLQVEHDISIVRAFHRPLITEDNRVVLGR